MKPTDFAIQLSRYLGSYLPGQSGCSMNTVRSYRDAFSLLLLYCRDERQLPPHKLTLEQIDRHLVEDFLHWLENCRGCSTSTRNNRLAAIHAFYTYLQYEAPHFLERCQEILSIPYKKAQKKVMSYLTLDEIQALLAQPNTHIPAGRRDLTMLSLLYDTGARVQELADLPDIFESESYDRPHMRMPDCQNELIEAVASVQPNTVVVLHNGSPLECPWAKNVAAILEMYLGGEGVGEACDQLLWGESNPCGRLAETFPMRLQDTPSFLNFPGDGKKVHYAEDVYVGYRYYDTKDIPVRWAFGHGLSYTTFEYKNLRLSAYAMDDETHLAVSADITNTGTVPGKEVVQLYVADLNGTAGRPAKELKGFCKVHLEPGETKTVTLEITARDLSFWHEELHDWYAPSGKYGILIGHASDEILLNGDIVFTTKKLLPLVVSPSTTMGELLNDPRTSPVIQQMLARIGDSNTAMDPSQKAMMEAMMVGMPLKSLIAFGAISAEQSDGLIAMLNNLLN